MTPFSIRPFNDYDLADDLRGAAWRRKWNKRLSSRRIFVEHAFGRLKGRFPWTRGITGYKLPEIFKTVEALIVLHNFLERRHDDPTDIAGFNGADEPDIEDVLAGAAGAVHMDLEGEDLHRTGLFRRKELLDLFIRMHE